MRYLAIDLGTSFLKGAVVDLDTFQIGASVRRPFPDAVAGLPPGHGEVDAHAIVAATRSLLDELAQAAPDAVGIVVCSQMHGMVLTDRDGHALTHAITWQDQRSLMPHPDGGGTVYERLVATISPDQDAATGNGMRPGLPLCSLATMAATGTMPRDAVPAALPDFVLATLAGSKPVSELTMAASMGMVDLATRDWHWELLASVGLDGLAWPQVAPVGRTAYEIEVGGRRLPCAPAVGDHQCALVGALLQSNELSLNVSTGSQAGVIVPDFVPGTYETRPYFDGRYLQAITRIPAGRALNAWVGLLTELARAEGVTLRDPWGTIAAAVENTPTTDLTLSLSVFPSALGDRGWVQGMHEANMHVGDLFRAAFVTMAENYASVTSLLQPPSPWQRVVFSGGLVQRFAPLRAEILARLKVPDRLCPTPEDTLLGLLALALVHAGRAASVEAAVMALSSAYGVEALAA